MFKIQDQDKVLALQLKTISTDPLLYSLDKQNTHFEEQAAAPAIPSAPDAIQRADELEKLRKHTLADLQVPVHAARSLAFSHLLEQSRSATLFSRRPEWLATIAWRPTALNSRRLIEAYILAMRRSHDTAGNRPATS